MSRRVLIHAGVVTCLAVCTAVPGRCQRQALQTGGPFELVKLYASDSQSGAQFGSSVAVDGNVAVVGAIQKAYVFRDHDGHWIEEQILQPPAATTRPLSVAVDGETIAVGASRPVPGAVTIYRYDGASWSQQAHLRLGGSYQAFGWSVDLDGGVLAVGDPDLWLMGEGVIGTVSVFRRGSEAWELEAFLLGTYKDARFGHSVSLSGDRLLVGVPSVKSSYIPTTYADLFWFNGASWGFLERLPQPNGVHGNAMGSAVALTRNAALISDPAADNGSLVDAGAAYLLRNAAEDPRLLQHAEVSTSGHENANHGQEVALSDDIALIGQRGLVRVRRIEENGWRLLATVRTGPQVPSNGRYLATDGRSHWIGQPYDGHRGEKAGAVLVLRLKELALKTSATTIPAGATLPLEARGGDPSARLLLALTEWDGAPTFLPLRGDFRDIDGARRTELRIPRELAGRRLGLTLYGGSESAPWTRSEVVRLEITP